MRSPLGDDDSDDFGSDDAGDDEAENNLRLAQAKRLLASPRRSPRGSPAKQRVISTDRDDLTPNQKLKMKDQQLKKMQARRRAASNSVPRRASGGGL